MSFPYHLPNRLFRSLRHVAIAAALSVAAIEGAAQGAPPRSDVEQRLSGLAGIERARALAGLVDAYRLDQPDRALTYGREALQLFERHTDPVSHVSTLNEMGWAHMTLGRYDSAQIYLESGRELGGRLGVRAGEARALSNLGTLHQRMGNPNEAVSLFTEALEIQRAIGADADAATSLNNLGYVYSTDLADYGRSLAYHAEALTIRQRLGDQAAIALSLNNIGIVYGRLRQHDRAMSFFERALAMRRQLGQQTRIAATLHNIGDTHLETGHLRRALAAHREALAVRETLQDPSAIATSHGMIGRILLAMDRPDSARAELLTALRLGEQVGDRGLNARTLIALSEAERAAGRLAAAESYARRALALAEEMGSRDRLRAATQELGRVQEARGDLSGALASLRRSHELGDSIFTAETSRRVAQLEHLLAQEHQTAELEQLRLKEAMARLQATERAAQRNAIAGVAIVLGLLGLLLYWRRAERGRLAESASMTDPLTGVKNRRYLDQTVPKDVAAVLRRYESAQERGGRPTEADLVFLLLDLDDFKRVNDEIGHAAGDRLLRTIANTVQGVVRDSELVVRLGGDEFLVVLRFCDRDQAPLVAERLRREISNLAATSKGSVHRTTCSIGFAAYPFDPDAPDQFDWREVIAIADIGTYAAKRRGRNRWVGYSRGDGPMPPPAGEWTVETVDALIEEGRINRHESNHAGRADREGLTAGAGR